MTVIRSRENPRVKAWIRLADEPRERRRRGLALIEGIHLVETCIAQGHHPVSLIVSETASEKGEIAWLVRRSGVAPVILSDAIFDRISDTEAPSGIAAEIEVLRAEVDPAASEGCVFLEGIQDAGNIGTIVRSAAAFGIPDVIAGRGCADPWSPKALRAGMGGHFFVRIGLSQDLASDVARFGSVVVCATAHAGVPLDSVDLRGRVAWVFGSEGAGVSEVVASAATLRATIETPGGAESLNVAASAAICFYERHRQLGLSRRAGRS